MDDRLYRSTTDRSLAGVCGGVAAWLDLDPSLVRIVWVLLTIMSGGIFLLVYVVMAVIVPEAPPGWVPRSRRTSGAPSAGPDAWTAGAQWQGGAPPPPSAPGGVWTGSAGWAGGGTGAPAPGAPSEAPGDWSRLPEPTSVRFGASQAGVVAGVVLIVLGVWFLVAQYVPIDWDLVWPIAVIALGAVLIVAAIRRRR